MTVSKMILFDIDGTLLLTGGVGRRAFEQAFEEIFGISDSWGIVHPDGKTDHMIFEEIFTRNLPSPPEPEKYQDLCERYVRYFAQKITDDDRFRIMPGVEDLLKILSEKQDCVLGLATGNFEAVAYLKLERGSLHQHFRFGGFGSDHKERPLLTKKAVERGFEFLKLEIPKDEIYIIGDAFADIEAGQSLGVKTVAVATGRASSDELKAKGPDFLLKDLSDAENFMKCVGY